MATVRNARWLRLFVLLATLVMIAAACGGDPDAESGDGDGGTDTGNNQQADTGDEGAPEFETKEEGKLIVGSDIPYPPFEMRKGGGYTGLDIDLINEIASRLELETEIVDTGFDTIFSQLAGGNFDVVVAAATVTPEREKQVLFSDAYYVNQQSLTVPSDSDVQTIDDLQEGDVVAVQNGTTGKAFAEENVPEGVEVRSFPEGPDTFTALEAGDVDAVIHDEPTALAEIEERQGLEIVQKIDTGEVYGIAVDPANEPLLEAINQTLAEMIEDGTYEEIYSKYPSLPPGGNVAAES
ncbi:MAG TPA: basic amino acid ABC transporter substrate-binding protein [Actinomycetota bacterium]|nr:basic amino acid ABC transporter substrate-binding protein [Actinomycetota bacterium]